MAERIVSPGVFTREKDLSFLPQGVAEIGAVLIGQTIKGPAFVPTRVESFNEFQQKFGGLRTYAYGGDDSTHRMIRDAEEKSRITCEICGSNVAKIRTNGSRGWLMCRCDNCWNYQNRN